MRRILLVAVVAVVATACHAKSDAPPCGTVAGQFFKLASDDLGSASVDDSSRRAVADQLPAMRDSLAIACSDGAWSPAVRTCMVSAPDHAAFQACEHQLTDDQRKALDHAADGKQRPSASR
jgi:hypothetical protein